jgi:DUF2934 family protein
MARAGKSPKGVTDPSASPRDESHDRAEMSRRSPDRIAARAYELYLARGAADGRDFDDWLAAEQELSSGPSQDDRQE